MTDGKYPPLTDSMDDLPRTLRREREARDRAQREQLAVAERSSGAGQSGVGQAAAYGHPESVNPYDVPLAYAGTQAGAETFPATVTRVQVPFFSLMGFFIKAVFAAIPAIIILIAMLYGLGVVLKMYFPWLVQTEILIRLPK